MTYRLVHLDLDGTLVDSGEDLVASTNHVRGTFGMEPLESAAVLALVGRGARVLVERALGIADAALFDEGIRRFLEHYEDHCLDRTRAYPGMIELVDGLRAEGVRFSIVTNKIERLARKIVDGLGITPRIEALVGGDTFPERKPDPRGVRSIHDRLGEPVGNGLMVGDSSVDVETARAAGLASCGVLWGFETEGVTRARPDHLVATPRELARVIRGLRNGQRISG